MPCPTVRCSHCLRNFGISKATADRCMNNRNSSIKHVESKAESACCCRCCCLSHGTRSSVRQVAATATTATTWGAVGTELKIGVVFWLLSYVSVFGLANHFEMQAAVLGLCCALLPASESEFSISSNCCAPSDKFHRSQPHEESQLLPSWVANARDPQPS